MSKVIALLPKNQRGYLQLRANEKVVLMIFGFVWLVGFDDGQWEITISAGSDKGSTHICTIWADYIQKGEL